VKMWAVMGSLSIRMMDERLWSFDGIILTVRNGRVLGGGGTFQWHFVHSKSPSDCSGTEPEALRYEAGV